MNPYNGEANEKNMASAMNTGGIWWFIGMIHVPYGLN